MTDTTTENVSFEYRTIRIPRDLELQYRDSYRSLGWIIVQKESKRPSSGHVTLSLKRDRRIKSRPMMVELQNTSDDALVKIAKLERSKTKNALMVALTIGLIGVELLAGSIFAIFTDWMALSIVLGAVSLAGWPAAKFAYGRIKASSTRRANPLIDREYEVLYAAGEKASPITV